MTGLELIYTIIVSGVIGYAYAKTDPLPRDPHPVRWRKQPINWRGYAHLALYIAIPASIIKFIMWMA